MAEEAKPTTDAELATLREMCAKPETWAVGSATALGLVARIDTECAARRAAEAQLWKPGDPRCDACDNGIANAWAYCAWCGTALKEPANG